MVIQYDERVEGFLQRSNSTNYMANQWFKFYGGEYLSDPKVLQLNALERSCWLTILCLASQSEDGVVRFLSEKQLLMMAGAISGATEFETGIFQKLEGLKMIRLSNGDVTVLNWQKRQYSEGYSRVKNFRKRQSNTEDNDRIEENRIEENRKESKDTPAKVNKNFFDGGEAYSNLLGEFSQNIDPKLVEREFKKFVVYWTESNKSGSKQRWEQQPSFEVKRRLYTWFSRIAEGKQLQSAGRGLA